MLAAIRDRTTWSLVDGGKQASWTPGHVRVPKNGDSRSKRFLEPRPLPHQYWGLEFRTSLTGAGDGAKCAFVELVENVSNVISGEEGWIVPSADSIRVAHILDNIAQHPSA
jgi:hypothetical protein